MGWSRYFHRKRWDEERARELEAYLNAETLENIARGLSPGEARHAARRKLGDPILIREEIYRMNTLSMLDAVIQDLRHGIRLLRLNPGFTIVAILSLTLGIGANTAIFQLLDAVRLRTLPVRKPNELARIRIANQNDTPGISTGPQTDSTYPLWEQIREHQQAFSGLFAFGSDGSNLTTGGQVRSADMLWVSGDFFNVLGVVPALGTFFAATDDKPGCGAPGVVLSYAFWQREYGGDPAAIGKTITLDSHPFPVLGVSSPWFTGLQVGHGFDVAVPLCSAAILRPERLPRSDYWWLDIMGRRKPDWSVERASAHLAAISPAIFEATQPTGYSHDARKYLANKLQAVAADTGVSPLRERFSDSLLLLLATAGLVLLVACANLANLMLARATARERELVIRLAIGASRNRLFRQMLSESLLLAASGAIFGILLARALSSFLVSFLSGDGGRMLIDLTLDWRVTGFTAALAILTCALFGLTPALRATRTEPVSAMRAGGRGLTMSRDRFGFRRVLVISQIAVSLALLVGGLLFSRSLRNLLNVDTGFRPQNVLIANVNWAALHITDHDLLDRLRAVQGVDAASSATIVPLNGSSWTMGVRFDNGGHGPSKFSWISPAYFKTLGTPLMEGRDFDDRDTATSQKVAIVNQDFARRYLGTADPIGKTFRTEMEPGYPETLYTVVGLVRNTHYGSLWEKQLPICFAVDTQYPKAGTSHANILIHTSAPVPDALSQVKQAISDLNPAITFDLYPMEPQIEASLIGERLMAALSAFFGGLAFLLATVGLYGVISYMVAQRRNEIGIRMALGADRLGVVAMILREAGGLLLAGVPIGIIVALMAGRAARSMLFGLQPNDPLTIATAVVALGVVAISASYIPARRAARLDPMAALREE